MFSVSNTFQALKWDKLMSCMSYFSSVARQSFVRTHTRSYSRRWRTKKNKQLWSTWRLQIEDHKNIQRRRKHYSTTRNSIYRHSQRESCDQIPYASSLVEALYSIPERSWPRPRLFVVRLHRGRQTSIILLWRASNLGKCYPQAKRGVERTVQWEMCTSSRGIVVTFFQN